MLQGVISMEHMVVQITVGNGKKYLCHERSKGWEIQAFSDPQSDDVIHVNDVIISPISYKRGP